MNQKKSSAELKSLAKEQLLGNYGRFVGAFAVIYAIYFALFSIAYVVMAASMIGSLFIGGGDDFSPALIASVIMTFIVFFIIMALFYCMSIGLIYMALQLSRGLKIDIKDVFFAFTHHPDKALGMIFLLFIINLLLSVPAIIAEFVFMDTITDLTSPGFWIYLILYIGAIVATTIVSLICSLCFFYYVDHPDMKVFECIRQSYTHMQGQKGRLFYIYLSFFGWYALVLLSCGLAAFWVVPYALTVLANFYRDVNGEFEPVTITTQDSATYYSI